MRKLLVKLIGVFSVFTGISALFKWCNVVFDNGIESVFMSSENFIIVTLSFAVYLFMFLGGIRLLKNKKSGFMMTIFAYFMQLFYVFSESVVYDLTAGYSVWLYLIDSSFFDFKSFSGTFFSLSFNISAESTVFGLNVFALVILVILILGMHSSEDNNKKYKDRKLKYGDNVERVGRVYSSREFIK